MATPGADDDNNDDDAELLGNDMIKNFRALAAKANFLAQDRPDLQFPVKEICREMSAPTTNSWKKLKSGSIPRREATRGVGIQTPKETALHRYIYI